MEEQSTSIKRIAKDVHRDGFAALLDPVYRLQASDVSQLYDSIMAKYHDQVQVAHDRGLDLSDIKNAEKIHGFYIRQGGRVDMQLPSLTNEKDCTNDKDRAIVHAFSSIETKWIDVITDIFQDENKSITNENGLNFALDYIGCVVSKPGDASQNWHLDGVHRNLDKHEPADRLNVFIPLVGITEDVGGTEMKKSSHIRITNKDTPASSFETYKDLESVTHYVEAGTPVVMDYRVWHRGLANMSKETLRPLLYLKYVKTVSNKSTGKRSSNSESADKKKKRITPVLHS